ncbi:alpha/beta hydrolase [Streptomyces sp. NPDC005438]|uniref:alpha/beta fold hydrolase n=1 Tax=Streptomyces sp. NPDC005438 TaxID=3156880 RepID=UPI0033A90328
MPPSPSPSTGPGLPRTAKAPHLVGAHTREGETLTSVSLPPLDLAVRARPPRREGLAPALLVHGLGGSSQNWSKLMAELDGELDCEAVDLPGFGDSPPPPNRDYTLTGHTRAVIRYLDASRRGPVHLFGNSMGGAVATKVAAARPDLVRTLTLVSPALPEWTPQRTAVPTALLAVPGVVDLFTRLTRHWTAEQRARSVLGLCYGDPARVTPEELALAVRESERRLERPHFWEALAGSARGIVDSYTLLGRHSGWRLATRVKAPTLLVYGGRDQLVRARNARRAARAFGVSRTLFLPEAGHVAMMEYPELVAQAARELIHDEAELTVPASRGNPAPTVRDDGGRRDLLTEATAHPAAKDITTDAGGS